MTATTISFPGLGIHFDPGIVAFRLFGFEVRWYGVIIMLGFLLAIIYCMARCEKFGIDQDSLLDLLIFAVPAALIGARLYYVVFNFDLFRDDPIRILYLWEGGLAIYGGIIAGVITAAIVARVKKIKIGAILDIGALGLLIGQAVGRWGNFINREAFGTQTDLPWRMELFVQGSKLKQAVHPCFIYESIWNVIGFVILHFISKKRKYDGQIFLMYVAWYGLGRSWIEGLRVDSLYVPGTNLRVSQFLAIASFLFAVVLLIVFAAQRRNDPEKLQVYRYRVAKAQAKAEAAARDAVRDPVDVLTESIEAAEDVPHLAVETASEAPAVSDPAEVETTEAAEEDQEKGGEQ